MPFSVRFRRLCELAENKLATIMDAFVRKGVSGDV